MKKPTRADFEKLREAARYLSQRTAFLDEAHNDLKRVVKVLRKDGHTRLALKVARLAMDTHPCLNSDKVVEEEMWRLGLKRRQFRWRGRG